MTALDLGVVAGGVAAIGAINWWFFLAGRKPTAAATSGSGVQEITIGVAGGYDPATIKVAAGRPVRLTFDRQETNSCSEELVFPAFGIRKFLPAFERTAVEFTPTTAGTYEFTCGMGMLRGRVVAE